MQLQLRKDRTMNLKIFLMSNDNKDGAEFFTRTKKPTPRMDIQLYCDRINCVCFLPEISA